MTESFKILVERLNIFRRKFYLFKLVKGLLITLLVSVVLFTLISLIEYFSYLPSLARGFIFYSAAILFVVMVIQFILVPVFQLLKMIRQISEEDINRLITNHFPEIKDRFLNIIELAKLDEKQYSTEIIWASIDQKIKEIRIFDFQNAVDFKKLRFILLYLLVSLGIVAGIVVFDKPVIAESNHRIINFKEQFSKPAPFRFILQNKDLVVNKGDEFTLFLTCDGDVLPQVVYINIEGNNFLMKKGEGNKFEYHIESVINDFNFFFTDLKYKSVHYSLKILPKPGISGFQVKLTPPAYTRIGNEKYDNIGDLTLPEGTTVDWFFKCIDTDSLFIRFNGSENINGQKNEAGFTVKKTISENTGYNIFIGNAFVDFNEVLSYSISVIPDLFPEINVVQTRDSFRYSRFYFKGEIADDYGFGKFEFHINVNEQDSVFPLDFTKNLINQEFYYTVDFSSFDFGEKEVSYYFLVGDNDQVNGSKYTASNSFIYKAPSGRELAQRDNEQFSEIEDMVAEGQQLTKEIKEGLQELQLKSLDSKVSDWEKSQLVNEIMNKKDQLENIAEQVKQQNQDLNNLLNTFNKEDKEVLEKQAMLEKLLGEIFSDELKELMEEFSKLAQEFNEKNFNKMSEQLNMSMDDLSKQLDRNLEMLRKMKVEQRLQEIIDKMYEMAEVEGKLAEEVEKEKNFDEIGEKDKHNKLETDELENRLKEALELNNELKKPMNYDDFEEEFKMLYQKFGENKENLEKKNKKKSAESIKSTSENMKSLAFNMEQLLKSNTRKQNMENLENLRQILSNLIYFSFSQENVMAQLKSVDTYDPMLNLLKRTQKGLKDQSVVIKDSLYALAERTPQISNMVNNELLNININLDKIAGTLDEGKVPDSRVSQQLAMTSVNNLTLLLNEALEQLEKEAAGNMDGDQQCENPGKKPGGKNLDMLKQSSESIKQQLQQMIEEIKKGNSQNMSQMLGESLMQHEMMQQMLRELMNDGGVGSDAKSQLQNIDKLLEQTRKELMNKSISEKSLLRQNQILSRLLEAEKAEMERDFDEKRESQTADDEFYSNPVKFFEYNKKVDSGIENLEQNIFKLNNFYNKKYKQYLNSIDEKRTR